MIWLMAFIGGLSLLCLVLINYALPLFGFWFVKRMGFILSGLSPYLVLLVSLFFGFSTLAILVLSLVLLPYWMQSFLSIEFKNLLLFSAGSFVVGSIVAGYREARVSNQSATKSEDS